MPPKKFTNNNRGLPATEGKYMIRHEAVQSKDPDHPKYDTCLVACGAQTNHCSPVRMSRDPLFESVMMITTLAHASSKEICLLLHATEMSDGTLDRMGMNTDEVQKYVRTAYEKAQNDPLFDSIKSAEQDTHYNTLRYVVYKYFRAVQMGEEFSMPEPRWLCDIVQLPAMRYRLLYFCPMIANDLLRYVSGWTRLIYRLMNKDFEILCKLCCMFWKNPTAFCFDDLLIDMIAPLKMPVAFGRGVQRILPKNTDAVQASGDEVFEYNDDASPDSAIGEGGDMIETAAQAQERTSSDPWDAGCGRQGDEKTLCRVKIMAFRDFKMMCAVKDVYSRFAVLSTENSRAACVLMVSIYQILCAQLHFGNTYCNRSMFDKIQQNEENLSHWGDPSIRLEALEMLKGTGLLRVFEVDKQECYALSHVERMEAFIYNFFMSKAAKEKSDPHPFAMVQAMDWHKECRDAGYNDEQERAFLNTITKRYVVINGIGGSGKTFVACTNLRILKKLGVNFSFQFASPTCMSQAQLIGQLTTCGIPAPRGTVSTAQKIIYDYKALIRSWEAAKCELAKKGLPTNTIRKPPPSHVHMLVLDEASMWADSLLYDLLTAITCDIIVCTGDLEQCMPISAGRPLHVLADYETANGSEHMSKLVQVYRNSGDIFKMSKAIRDSRVDLFTGRYQEVVNVITSPSQLSGAIAKQDSVTAIDKNSGFAGDYVAIASILLDRYNEKLTSVGIRMEELKLRPSVYFVTYSKQEATSINHMFATAQRRLNIAHLVALAGPAGQRDFEPTPGMIPRDFISTFSPEALVGTETPFTKWSFAIGDYVRFGKNMKDLHGFLNKGSDFINGWFLRFGHKHAPPMLREVMFATGDDDYVNNGDAGVIVQFYEFTRENKCMHGLQEAETYKKSGRTPPASFLCAKCACTSRPIAGPGFAMEKTHAFIERNKFNARHITKRGKLMVMVVWLDRTQRYVHVPLPVYEMKKIETGCALTAYRAQGMQMSNVVVVCSNQRLSKGDSHRNHYWSKQVRNEKQRHVGQYKIESYFYNRRFMYVALSRGINSVVFLLSGTTADDKLKQLMEHDPLSPSILEEMFCDAFDSDYITAETSTPAGSLSSSPTASPYFAAAATIAPAATDLMDDDEDALLLAAEKKFVAQRGSIKVEYVDDDDFDALDALEEQMEKRSSEKRKVDRADMPDPNSKRTIRAAD
jgi:hypothetical protein